MGLKENELEKLFSEFPQISTPEWEEVIEKDEVNLKK